MKGVKLRSRSLALGVSFVLFVQSLPAWGAGFSKIGNGDDGGDLEAIRPLTDGPIVAARARAVKLLESLHTDGIPALGLLIPEVRTSTLYAAETDKVASLPSDQGSFHGDLQGRVYARTFASPHAATRFFPAARALSAAQLTALHVHEGLHRSLPASVREDEAVVTQITLAITSPGATHDQVRRMVVKVVPQQEETTPEAAPPGPKRISSVGYELRQFWKGNELASYSISRMHAIQSELYPFGGALSPVGLGIGGSLIETPHGLDVGPIVLLSRFRLAGNRDFDLGLWGSVALTTISNAEFKRSPFGRDVYTLGVSIRKAWDRFYFGNEATTNFGSEAGEGAERSDYGTVFGFKVRGGLRAGALDVGVYADLHLGSHRVFSSSRPGDMSRYRIFSVGPEASYRLGDLVFALYGRVLVGASGQSNFDFLGNLMGPGVSHGSIGTSITALF